MLSKYETRLKVEDDLRNRGLEKVRSISNKAAAITLGLLPTGVKGIGNVNAGKMLRAWASGEPVPTWEQLLGGIQTLPIKLTVVHVTKIAKTKRPRQVKEDFFSGREWRELRYQAILAQGRACQCCGRSKQEHGVVLHVDHIKPRSKFPKLALELSNLQVLCEDCNLGKSNTDQTDWRPVMVVSNG